MSGIQGMSKMSLQDLRSRVAPPITEICDDFFAEKWNANHFGVKGKFTPKQLEAHRQYLGVPRLGKEEYFFLISRDMMPQAYCLDCSKAIFAIRWYALAEDGTLQMDDFGIREFGQTAIVSGPKGEFVGKFCYECAKERELPEGSRWQSYKNCLREIARHVERSNAEQVAAKKQRVRHEKEMASMKNIRAMLGTPEPDIELLTEKDLLPEETIISPTEVPTHPPAEMRHYPQKPRQAAATA